MYKTHLTSKCIFPGCPVSRTAGNPTHSAALLSTHLPAHLLLPVPSVPSAVPSSAAALLPTHLSTHLLSPAPSVPSVVPSSATPPVVQSPELPGNPTHSAAFLSTHLSTHLPLPLPSVPSAVPSSAASAQSQSAALLSTHLSTHLPLPVPSVPSAVPSSAVLLAVDQQGVPGMDRADVLAEYLVELRSQTALTLTNQQVATIVSLWDNLEQLDKDMIS
ncbi:uncharacterized protein LOC127377267 [Dicentrarchus labrax]|uniref:uncharacterized protein LOC127377267 n=1 Tax=Dicentrarchus labrax TaxID=13489 RepID=UPI0021F59FC7|nr:uncharacterized protein LOC127377267 [Dicentrarchus labrax]